MNITKDRFVTRDAMVAVRKAMTKSVTQALRERMYREAYLDLLSLIGAPETNDTRVRRLRNMLVTYIERELLNQPCGGARMILTMKTIKHRAEALPVGWTAVEGGAA